MALNEAIQEGQQPDPVVGPPAVGAVGQKFQPTTLPAHHSQHQWLHEQLLASPLEDSYGGGGHSHTNSHGGGHGFNVPAASHYGSYLGPRPASPSIQRPSSANFLAHPTPVAASKNNPYMQYSHSHSNSASMVGGGGSGIGGSVGGGRGPVSPESVHASNAAPGSAANASAPETPFRRGHRKASSLSTNVFTSPNKDGRQVQSRDGDLMFPVRQPAGPPPVDELQSTQVNFDANKVAEILRT